MNDRTDNSLAPLLVIAALALTIAGPLGARFRALQLTPSIRFSFDRGSGPRYLPGLGVGYYEADITELSTYWWGLQTESELWSNSSPGGYLSLDIDFPRRKQRKPHGFFMSVRIHSIDFGRVRDERPFGPGSGTLGPDAGDLSGPLTVLHFGYQWLDRSDSPAPDPITRRETAELRRARLLAILSRR